MPDKKEVMFRITKKPRGYIVEVKTHKWTLFGIKTIWKPFVKTSGMDSVWHHSTKEFAIQNLLKKIKEDIA